MLGSNKTIKKMCFFINWVFYIVYIVLYSWCYRHINQGCTIGSVFKIYNAHISIIYYIYKIYIWEVPGVALF